MKENKTSMLARSMCVASEISTRVRERSERRKIRQNEEKELYLNA